MNQTTGKEITLKREGGVYILDMWVKDEGAKAAAAVFRRPGTA